jgi:hypothetical protein
MSFRLISAAVVAAFSLMLILAAPTRALAHESRTVGKYQMVVGFFVEPAYEGQKNGLDLRVRLPGPPQMPVTGLEKTLQVEITFIGTGKSITKPIRAVSSANDPGHYTADVLPTQPGQYRFRIFGTVEGDKVDEAFTSGDKFSNVEKASDLTFPDEIAQVRSVQGAAVAAQQTADDAAKAASTARVLAVAALALAVISGGAALRLAIRK